MHYRYFAYKTISLSLRNSGESALFSGQTISGDRLSSLLTRVQTLRTQELKLALKQKEAVDFDFQAAIDNTKERLEHQQERSHPNQNTIDRLEKRLKNLSSLAKILEKNEDTLEVVGVFGWGDQCYGAKSGQGVSEFDTFFIRNRHTGDVLPVQLESTFQIQVETLTGQLKEVLLSPSPSHSLPKKSKEISMLSKIGRVYIPTESRSQFLDETYYWKNGTVVLKELAPVSVSYTKAEPLRALNETMVIPSSKPVTSFPGIEDVSQHQYALASTYNGLPTERISAPKLGVQNLVDQINAYMKSFNKNKLPIDPEWLNKIITELGSKETQRVVAIDAGYRFGEARNGAIHLPVDMNKDALPLTRVFANWSLQSGDLVLAAHYRSADWALKLFLPLFNAANGYPFLKFDSSGQSGEANTETYLSPPVAKAILDNLSHLKVPADIWQSLQHIKGNSDQELFQKETQLIKTMKEQINSGNTGPLVELSFYEFTRKLQFISNYRSVLMTLVIAPVLKQFKMAPEEEKRVVTALLYQSKIWQKVSDKLGICCPTCAEGATPSHDAVCNLPLTNNSKYLIRATSLLTKPSEFLSFPVVLKQDISTNIHQITGEIKTSLASMLNKAGENSRIKGMSATLDHYEAMLTQYNASDSYKYAMMMDYILQIINLVSMYDPDSVLKGEVNCLVNLVKTLLPLIEPDATAPNRFEMAALAARALHILRRENCISEKEYTGYITRYNVNLDGGNEVETQYARNFKIESSAPKETALLVDRPFAIHLQDIIAPKRILIFTGFLGAGKTEYLKQWLFKEHSQSKVTLNGQKEPVFLVVNDAAGGFDTDMLSSTTTADNEMLVIAKEDYYTHLAGTFKLEVKKEGSGRTAKPIQDVLEIEGCICCKDRDKLIQGLRDINDGHVARDASVIIAESTGIGDGQGILNSSFVPHGRLFYSDLFTLIDPSDHHWAQFFNGKTLKTEEEIKSDHILSIYWDQLDIANVFVINKRGVEGEDETVERIKTLIEAKRTDGNYTLHVQNCKTNPDRVTRLDMGNGIDLSSIAMDEGESELKKAKLSANYVSCRGLRTTEFLPEILTQTQNGNIIRLKGRIPGKTGQITIHVTGGKLYLNDREIKTQENLASYL